MKRIPSFARSKKTRGEIPKQPPSTVNPPQKDGNVAVRMEPDSTRTDSSPSWSAVPRASLHTFDFGKFLTQLFPVVDSLWKAESRWSKADQTEQGGSLKHLGRNLKAGLDALHAAGFEVKDHTQERYVEGSRVEVLAFQPVEGIRQPTVIETLKPTIYFQDRLVRPGQVIVGKPVDLDASINA